MPNANDPLPTVGPGEASDGYGNTHVMYPTGGWHAEAWAGWPVGWDTPWMNPLNGFGYGRSDQSGYCSRVSTVDICVDLNSRELASFPIYGVRNRQRVALPTWSVNPEPEVYADWSEFAKALTNSLQYDGEAFIYATAFAADGYPSRFMVLPAQSVDVEADGRGGTIISIGGSALDSDEVLHIKYQTLAGRVRGVSPIEWVGRNLVSAAALESYATDIATHGVWAVLRHPGNLNPEQSTDLRENWMAARARGRSAPAILSGGIELETLSISPSDMALLDLRVFDEQRIAAAFGVPPFLIGLPQAEGLTYANATSLFDYHWRATLRPLANSIAAPLSSFLLPRGTTVEFDRDEYVQPGLVDRANAYSTLHSIVDANGNPAITVDEIRENERLTEGERLAS